MIAMLHMCKCIQIGIARHVGGTAFACHHHRARSRDVELPVIQLVCYHRQTPEFTSSHIRLRNQWIRNANVASANDFEKRLTAVKLFQQIWRHNPLLCSADSAVLRGLMVLTAGLLSIRYMEMNKKGAIWSRARKGTGKISCCTGVRDIADTSRAALPRCRRKVP